MKNRLTINDVAERLRRAGIAPTYQRLAVAEVLFGQSEHFTADQILSQAAAHSASISKATVYNTLRLFVEKRLIRELIVDRACVVYDPNMTPHHHFYDVATGRLTDIPAENVEVSGLPPAPEGTITEAVEVVVRTRPAS